MFEVRNKPQLSKICAVWKPLIYIITIEDDLNKCFNETRR